MRKKFVYLAAVITLVSGCSYQLNVTEAENKVTSESFGTSVVGSNQAYSSVLGYGRTLGQTYLSVAANASRDQDIGFLVLLGIATASAGRAIDGASATELGQFAVGGVAANQGVRYINSSGATQSLITASEQMNCLVSAGTFAQPSINQDKTIERTAKEVLLASFDTVRVNLRSALAREAPDYDALVASLSSAVQENAATRSADTTAANSALANLKARAAACVL